MLPGNLLCTILVELLGWNVFCVCKHKLLFYLFFFFNSPPSLDEGFISLYFVFTLFIISQDFFFSFLFLAISALMKHLVLDKLFHNYIFDSLVSIFFKLNARINICASLFLKPSFLLFQTSEGLYFLSMVCSLLLCLRILL